ncbi:hypothetical protein CRG98_004267 [Punica granatum]|uniref:Beta-ketoacyl-[acyl-carrier-protein] synthase III C-terminal domain-containing protein n=1 Tax=Punica granatum TaxID=22663 RepID=A0A2I0L3P8_PUNGR|nr:hypothetical protein CRG98_004267 [Punica granatum]
MVQVDADDVDMIQKALDCKKHPLSFDITAACSCFVLGLVSAACHIRGGGFDNVLVISADSLSRYVDWADRGTCVLFGDAAGAVLVQANQRIIDAVATRLEVPQERVISNLANYGNTSVASIPLALDKAVRSGKVKPGHMIASAGFGARVTWGSAIVRWG